MILGTDIDLRIFKRLAERSLFGADGEEGGEESLPDDPSDIDSGGVEEKTFSESYVKKLRTENANTRNRLREEEAARLELEQRIVALEAGNSTNDPEPAPNQNDPRLDEIARQQVRLEQEIEQERVASAIIRQAARMGFNDPEDAVGLVGRDSLEITASRPTAESVENALKALAEDKPYLLTRQEEVDPGDPDSTRRTPETDKTEQEQFDGRVEHWKERFASQGMVAIDQAG